MNALREKLKRKDEDLLTSVERFSALEGALKKMDEELELSRGVEAQCRDLQGRVNQLQNRLDDCHFEVDRLRG